MDQQVRFQGEEFPKHFGWDNMSEFVATFYEEYGDWSITGGSSDDSMVPKRQISQAVWRLSLNALACSFRSPAQGVSPWRGGDYTSMGNTPARKSKVG
jgi:hypothetical protein